MRDVAESLDGDSNGTLLSVGVSYYAEIQIMLRIDDSVSVGGQPSDADISQLLKDGYRTVVNFRAEGEERGQLQPGDEQAEVEALGMKYVHLPTAFYTITSDLFDRFRAAFANLPRPIYAHCATGKRAAAMVLAQIACQRRMSVEDITEAANRWGLKERRDLIKLVQNYVSAHTGN